MNKIIATVSFLAAVYVSASPSAPIRLWPGVAPGETREFPAESDTTKPTDRLVNGVHIVRLGNVTQPTITVYRPDPAKDTGAAVIVAPGGGFNILAWELEGTEVCEWLNSIGVTGVLLKYRVPSRPDRARHAAALDDAQRALGLVRHRAAEWGLDPKRIGMLGFSAGAHLSAALATNHASRTYPAVDAADAVSCRPDFLVLIYPGGIVDRDNPGVLRLEVVPVKGDTPPVIIVMTQDDPVRVENALVYYTALKQAEVPAEMHLYPTGGHGYGLRRNEHLVTTWPDRVADWLKVGGWLQRAP
jgi:acetyl esterase/lipase